MTLILAILVIGTILGFWIAGIERSHHLTLLADLCALEHEYEVLRQAHEIALDDCEAMTQVLLSDVKRRHPAARHLNLVGGDIA